MRMLICFSAAGWLLQPTMYVALNKSAHHDFFFLSLSFFFFLLKKTSGNLLSGMEFYFIFWLYSQ